MISADEDPSPGINLVGFLEAESGLGEVSRRLARAVAHAGLPLAAIAHRDTPSRQLHPAPMPIGVETPYDINVLCLNADELVSFVRDVGTGLFAGRYSAGVWFWETPVFEASRLAAARYLDEIWVASEFVRAAVEPRTDVPVHVVPLPIERPPPPESSRADLGLPDGFMFLFVFDFISGERKNPTAVVEAFKLAFAPGEGPVLVLKSINGSQRKPQLLEKLHAAGEGRTDIVIRDGYVSPAERDAFVAACDCYVSLHRSEGFGLTIAEAMALGKPVIATAHSGNLDFMDEGTSHLVDFRSIPIPNDWWAYQPGAEWADPDVEDAAARMRDVFEDQEGSRRMGADAGAALLERYSLERTASFIVQRAEAGRATKTLRSRSATARAQLAEVSRTLADGVSASLASRARGARGTARRLLRRMLWPELVERHQVESSLLDVLTQTQRSLEELERRIGELERQRARDER